MKAHFLTRVTLKSKKQYYEFYGKRMGIWVRMGVGYGLGRQGWEWWTTGRVYNTSSGRFLC